MSIFKNKLGNTAPTGMKGNYVLKGNHTLELIKLEVKDSQQSDGTKFFIAEFRVTESDNTAQRTPCAVVWNLSKKPTMGNIRNLLEAIEPSLAKATPEVIEKAAEEAIGPGQPCAGALVKCLATDVKTRAGGDFTRLFFYPHDKSLQEMEQAGNVQSK